MPAHAPACTLLSRPPQCCEWGEERRGSKTATESGAVHPRCEALSFPTNRMQVSINSINGQCLLAIKIAQRLLVSGSKMDDQWPWRSQRSKMTITLKCNLCWPPAPGLGGGAAAASRQRSPASQAVVSLAASSASSRAGGLWASWTILCRCPPRQRAHRFVPTQLPLTTSHGGGCRKGRAAVLLPAPRPPQVLLLLRLPRCRRERPLSLVHNRGRGRWRQ